MKGFERIVSNVVFVLLCLLTMMLVFEPHVQVPYWLQPFGRMHPLLLHFPVVLVFLLIFNSFLKNQIDPNSYQKINSFLLSLTALTTALTAVMGFLLFTEGYSSELMTWHKWLGVGLAFLVYLLIFVETKKLLYYPMLYGGGIIMVLVGHFGAGVTHGANFITEPLLVESAPVVDEYTPIFQGFVQPVLDKKCVSCHNPDKHKGDLIMTSISDLLKGGENGPVWISGDSEGSEIVRRAVLPEEHEEHMPPEGKPQLTTQELQLIGQWIDSGADTLISLASLPDSIPLKTLVHNEWLKKEEHGVKAQYNFAFADEELINSLNGPYRAVMQKSPKSPAIEVAVFGRSTFKPESISELSKIKEQVVSLNLSHLPITDASLEHVAKMVHLEELNLNFTDVTSEGLAKLAPCSKLKSLSLSGTQVDKKIGTVLNSFPELKVTYLWGSELSKTELQSLRNSFPAVNFVEGSEGKPDEAYQLGAPILSNKTSVLSKGEPITLVHKLKGVDIRFTTDGSVPDSTSQLYTKPLEFDTNFALKAKAFKEGWEPSDEAAFSFFQKGEKPISMELLSKPNALNRGLGGLTLMDDFIGGERSVISLAWLGFTKEPLIAMADFGEAPPTISELLLSYGYIGWRGIAAPGTIEIWGGNTKDGLQLLKKHTVDYKEEPAPRGVANLSVKFGPHDFRYYKIVATQFEKLPSWHPKKGEKGQLFVDELFFYQ